MVKKKLITFLICICLCLSLVPFQAAADDSSFEGRSWDDVIGGLIEKYDADGENVSVGLAYFNTVTGEEHYYNKEEYYVTASMFKIPINMLFIDKIAAGEIPEDVSIGGFSYKTILDYTILNSDNEKAELMWKYLGGYRTYREQICPYMGVNAETVDEMYWKNNYFTPEQMLHCLKQLYEGSEQYAELIDKLLQAEPNNYFNYHKQNYAIAHKYGYFTEGYTLILNDCGIAYTSDPILIVAFTRGLNKTAYDFLADYCTLMCDYAQYNTGIRKAEEQAAEEAAAIAELENSLPGNRPASQEQSASAEAPSAGTEEPVGGMRNSSSLSDVVHTVLIVLTVIAALACAVICVKIAKEKKIRLVWSLLAVIIASGGLLYCIVSPEIGSFTVKTEGNPQETVTLFFDSVISGNYSAAYGCLDNYSSLGLENTPEDEAGALFYDKVKSSFSYKLHSGCEADGINATQQVLIRYLDASAVAADLKEETEAQLERLVSRRAAKDIYDEDHNYFPEVTEEAYLNALTAILDRAEDYYATKAIELRLVYSKGEWKIIADNALFNALCGGTSY